MYHLKVIYNKPIVVIPAVAYVRVSTEMQDPTNQIEYLKRWSESRGFQILKFYVDEAVSGLRQ